jgi:hypothetical protein
MEFSRLRHFMKEKSFFFGIAVFLCAIFYIPIAHSEALPSIIISEIQVQGDNADDEFIELYNASDTDQEIKDFKLQKSYIGEDGSTKKVSIKSFSRTPFILKPEHYYLWANSDGEFASFADITTSASLTSKSTIELLNKNVVQDFYSWDNDTHSGKSIVRNIASGEWSFSNTPSPTRNDGALYKKRIPCSEKKDVDSVRINEIFPDPENENDEFIELYNVSDKTINLKSWKIKDKVKTYPFSDTDSITAKGYFILEKSLTKIELNNNSDERVTLIDENGNIKDEVCYEKTKKNVSLNYTPANWRGGTPTPGVPNQINNLPETQEKVPKNGYRGTAVIFNAKGKDSDNDTLKYIWDFGDGHKSYKEKTSHKYEQNGIYKIALTTTDGSDDVIETFTLKIESYPHPKIRITSFTPNPTGKDTDNEWLMLENRGKKTVNLKGFSIATGWKNLVNHPIRDDFIIKPDQEIKLTRANSLFTLPNQKGKVELRAPDGKVLQKIKYKLKESAAEDAAYRKKKGKRWNWEETAEEPAKTNTEAVPSDSEENSNTEEPLAIPDTNTQPEEENKEENPDF